MLSHIAVINHYVKYAQAVSRLSARLLTPAVSGIGNMSDASFYIWI